MKRLRLILFPITLLCACGSPTGPEVDWSMADFDRAWELVDSRYPYLEYKQIDWAAVGSETRARLEEDDSGSVHQGVVDLLRELRDGHVYLEIDGSRDYPYRAPRTDRDRQAYSDAVARSYFGGRLLSAGGDDIRYQVDADSAGYIRISSLVAEELPGIFEGVMARVMDTDGLIIDVRHNGGGSARNSNEIVKWFIDAPMEKPVAYHDGQMLRFNPLEPHHTTYGGKVVVLINGMCFSESERFAEMMKQAPTVTVVGDTTGGGSCGGGDRFELPNGSTISFGTYDYRRYDGQPWEWLGVAPDVRVAQTRTDVDRGRDPQLEHALTLAKGRG